MPFTVKSRVNHPLSITLDLKNSLHLGPYDTKDVEDDFRNCEGIRNAIRSNMLVVVPIITTTETPAPVIASARPVEQKGNDK